MRASMFGLFVLGMWYFGTFNGVMTHGLTACPHVEPLNMIYESHQTLPRVSIQP
jgi:hypothetical protein